jgi:serine/threonine protein kinase
MIPESPDKTPDLAETVVPKQPAGDPPKTPPHETVSLLGLARISTSGGQHFVPPSVDELAAALPQFAIEAMIGAGGMGAVYRVRQKGLDRVAALKVLPRELADRQDFQERFMREAKALANLNHPHLVTVYEVGQTNGRYWLLMELVDGANLREVMSTGRLSPEQALRIVPQLCDALQYAHDHGVVHRDIKPENILIDTQGRLKLTDFGLAKMINTDNHIPGGSLTQSGTILGTMHYMAPEQFEGTKVDHRADIYAVGVVLYEMLTGGLPLGRFQPPSRQIAIDVRIDEVVLKALDKDPNHRYQRASDVRIDVERVRSDAKPAPAAGEDPRGKDVSTDGEGEQWSKKEEKAGESAEKTNRPKVFLDPRGESPESDDKEYARLLDRRIFCGMVMAISGIATVGMSVFNGFYSMFYALWETRRDGIGNVPYTTDELSFALSQHPKGWMILGVLAGLAMVAGGWSLLTLRVRSLVVLGGIGSLALVPVIYPLPVIFSRDEIIFRVFVAALLTVYVTLFCLRKSKIADCFDRARIAKLGYAYPSKGKSWGYGLLLLAGLLMGVGVGYHESIKPLNRKLFELADRHPGWDIEARGLFKDQTAIRVSEFRRYYVHLGKILSADVTLQASLSEAGWSQEQHKKLDQVITHLEDMRRREPSAALRKYSSLWTIDELTWKRLAMELCLEAQALVAKIEQAITVLASKMDPKSVDRGPSVGLNELREFIPSCMGRTIQELTSEAAYLGAITPEEYKTQRDVMLGLSDQTLQSPQSLEAARQQLTRVWYSKEAADNLMVTIRQVSPYDRALHTWLEEVLRSRTTTTGLVFERDIHVESP